MDYIRPDGGWGWVVVAAALMIAVIKDGMKYSFGIIYTELLKTFGVSKAATSLVISIQIGMRCFSGPFAGALVNKWGCRVVGVVGTLLGCTGFLISTFATSIVYLYFSFGLVAGVGYGLLGLATDVAMMRYFDKNIGAAVGTASMGAGLGTIVFNPLSKVLIDEYTWRGTLLIFAGFILNGLICTAVFRPLPKLYKNTNHDSAAPVEKIDSDSNTENNTTKTGTESEHFHNVEGYFTCEEASHESQTSDIEKCIIHTRAIKLAKTVTETVISSRVSYSDNDSQYEKEYEVGDEKIADRNIQSDKDEVVDGANDTGDGLSVVDNFANDEDQITVNNILNGVSVWATSTEEEIQLISEKVSSFIPAPNTENANNLQHRSHIYVQNDIGSCILYEDKPFLGSNCDENNGSVYTTKDNIDANGKYIRQLCVSKIPQVSKLIDFTPLLHPGFLVLVIVNMLAELAVNMPTTYIPDLMVDTGYQRQDAVWVFFVSGIVNTFCRMLAGWIADRKCINRVYMCMAVLVASGLVVALWPYSPSFGFHLAFGVLFGIFIGSTNALRPALLPHLFGIENIANHVGLVMFCSGFTAFGGIPLAGALFDGTGSYNWSFIIGGLELLLSGMLVLLVPWLNRRYQTH